VKPNLFTMVPILFFLSSPLVFAQSPEVPLVKTLPRGFDQLELGLSLEQVKELLKNSPYFSYRGDPDVSLLNRPLTNLIETEGNFYILRGAFQFYQEKLHSITLVMNPRMLDYFSFFTSFSKKYGLTKALDPSRAYWEDESTRLVLEKPLTIKYLDIKTLNSLTGETQTTEAQGKIAREKFIEKF